MILDRHDDSVNLSQL